MSLQEKSGNPATDMNQKLCSEFGGQFQVFENRIPLLKVRTSAETAYTTFFSTQSCLTILKLP
jgi:hypothetical protein